jgi:hypothetical protein
VFCFVLLQFSCLVRYGRCQIDGRILEELLLLLLLLLLFVVVVVVFFFFFVLAYGFVLSVPNFVSLLLFCCFDFACSEYTKPHSTHSIHNIHFIFLYFGRCLVDLLIEVCAHGAH